MRIDPGNTAVTPLDFYDYPISHSLVMVLGWAALFGGVYYLFTRYRKGAWVVAAVVLSHWFLDFLSHRPDLPVLPTQEGERFGLGLWHSVAGTLIVEVLLFAAGILIYTRTTRPRDRIGRWGFTALMATLFLIYIANIFGPPPPSEQAIAVAGCFSVILFAWPYWVGRHRENA